MAGGTLCLVSAPTSRRLPRMEAKLREGEEETVKPLELFFDLVFVLALTQCTALMADEPTWEGWPRGLLVLGVLWWAWVGYAWLTSVIDPEEGEVRLVMFGVMAAFLVCALCVPGAFDDAALEFAIAYGVVRFGQIGLFEIASRERPRAAQLGDRARGEHRDRRGPDPVRVDPGRRAPGGDLGRGASCSTSAGPYFFGSEGWKLVPESLRGAPRPDRDHRPGRVDRRDRRRRDGRHRRSG